VALNGEWTLTPILFRFPLHSGAFGFFAFSQSRAGNAAPVGLHLAAQELFWRVVVCVAAKEILMKSYLAASSLGAALVLAATF
jgi:hypothetical protein